jgi:hypothetical protein
MPRKKDTAEKLLVDRIRQAIASVVGVGGFPEVAWSPGRTFVRVFAEQDCVDVGTCSAEQAVAACHQLGVRYSGPVPGPGPYFVRVYAHGDGEGYEYLKYDGARLLASIDDVPELRAQVSEWMLSAQPGDYLSVAGELIFAAAEGTEIVRVQKPSYESRKIT